MSDWYQTDAATVVQQLKTNVELGLSHQEASHRLEEIGPNELVEVPLKHPWQILWEQLSATTVVVLIGAALISALLKDYKDTLAILAIVILNALLGFTQDYRALQAFAALKRLAVPKVKVRRDGHWQEILARELVPGDVILLEAGNVVPADGRLLESNNLRIQESAFTGESEAVNKGVETLAGTNLTLGDRTNMVCMGTVVIYGRGQAVITATGMNTELGKIAQAMQSVEPEPTPLQRRLDQLGRRLALATLGLVILIFCLGLLRGENLHLLILTSVSIAVAVIPEGLPAVVTIALAIGSRRMLNRHALIRKLPAVETLGSVTVICSDKTGTLTENQMTVNLLQGTNRCLELPPANDEAMAASALCLPNHSNSKLDADLALLLVGSVLCNDTLLSDANDAENHPLGDPTETALVVAAQQLGFHKPDLDQAFPRLAEWPFDSDRKSMTTLHKVGNQTNLPAGLKFPPQPYLAFTKGAFSRLMPQCTHVWVQDHAEPLNKRYIQDLNSAHQRLAQTGIRILGVACRGFDLLPVPFDPQQTPISAAEMEQDLIFIGLVGMMDPVRSEAKQAVNTCQKAGIRPIMITGDHPLTARHIAAEVGIDTQAQTLTGADLNQYSITDLEKQINSVSVYARVSPQQKLKIVEALQNRGHIVAMTGDGVNDAPALRKADIGVAMGIAGTEVAKEAADMVLLDDNFATIVAAVQEGRVIYDNIRKFIKYSMTGNASGVWIMLLAPFVAMPLPLLPLQILWINLLADGLLALALSVEPAESNTMLRPPYPPKENIFGRGVGLDIVWVGLLTGLAILLLGYQSWIQGQPYWQTQVFVTLAFSRMSLALAMRSQQDLLWQAGLFTNPPMLWAVTLTFILQVAVMTLPKLQIFFSTMPLPLDALGWSLAVSTVGFWGIELKKGLLHLRRKSQTQADAP
ncbi:HAD-IC family P-type ATPase [Synechococcales cyanobacterium C]|uniref:HAD-IC family P-type ATPase n=1 Tax=Petrachloros mirabilis ULC683 TaxID=2781853 RepID=A0A8K1ZWZ4_9CYAN|nr:cation-translocating P-type ATPase [Petrachloros mirabilis]NCJ05408.1 HAD-IC family P-type ATPase [Petrachloros mirabilis ULC683]